MFTKRHKFSELTMREPRPILKGNIYNSIKSQTSVVMYPANVVKSTNISGYRQIKPAFKILMWTFIKDHIAHTRPYVLPKLYITPTWPITYLPQPLSTNRTIYSCVYITQVVYRWQYLNNIMHIPTPFLKLPDQKARNSFYNTLEPHSHSQANPRTATHTYACRTHFSRLFTFTEASQIRFQNPFRLTNSKVKITP